MNSQLGRLGENSHFPRNWQIKPLKRAATFTEGPGVLANDFAHDGIPLLRIAGIAGRIATLDGCNFLAPDVVEKKWRHFRVKPGDLLISGSASTGLCSEVDETTVGAIPYTGIIIVRPVPGETLKEFLRWFFLSDYFSTQVDHFKAGSAIQHFGPTHLSQMSIVLPPLDVQRAIAAYLDREIQRIDDLIDAKKGMVRLINEKLAAVIASTITRGLHPEVSLRHSDADWLGSIPAHWQSRRVAALFRERDQRGEPDLPLLEVSISSGVALREFSDDRIESTAADFNSYKVARKQDIVFNKMRMWQGAVGVAPLDGLVSPDYTVATSCGDILPEFAGQLFRTAMFSAECARHSHGIVWDRLRLYWEGFREIVLPLPPEDEQLSILNYVGHETSKASAFRSATERTIGLLKERRAALIAEAVTGQIEVD